MTTTIHARHQLNGNTREQFIEAARALTAARQAVEEAAGVCSMNVTHGRNYQHYTTNADALDARDDDLWAFRCLGDAADNIKGLIDALEEIYEETN